MEEKQLIVPSAEHLQLLHRRGFTAHLRKDGTVFYTKCPAAPKKPPKFSRDQLLWAQAQLDGAAHSRDGTAGRTAGRLGIKTTTTLRSWLKKLREQPELWDHPQAPTTLAPDAKPRTRALGHAAEVFPVEGEAAGGAGGMPRL